MCLPIPDLCYMYMYTHTVTCTVHVCTCMHTSVTCIHTCIHVHAVCPSQLVYNFMITDRTVMRHTLLYQEFVFQWGQKMIFKKLWAWSIASYV